MAIKRFWSIILLGLLSCTSDFDKGQEKFAAGEYEEAGQFFKKIKQTDSDFEKATKKLAEIDSIYSDRVYDLAIEKFNKGSDQDSKILFFKIDRSNHNYVGAQKYLQKIDSIEAVRKLEAAKRYKEEKVKVGIEVAKAKDQIKILFNELIDFKDDMEFKRNGFAVGSKYNLWLKKVQELKGSRTEKLLVNLGFVPGDLEMLGFEYVKSKGTETEYSLWARKTITDGLKK